MMTVAREGLCLGLAVKDIKEMAPKPNQRQRSHSNQVCRYSIMLTVYLSVNQYPIGSGVRRRFQYVKALHSV